MANEVEILTPKEVAMILKVKPATIYVWLHREMGPPFFKIGGTIRFRRESVIKWLEAKEAERRRRSFED